ncbi:hypothetical protein [uncultured Zoogloea sp.]|uniref:hypothetical protein n=1 Tax=uncultured Zoogloea sp. TaxID=160237 RepID=UPI002621E583|nr:hypothetical protein [uncultured Zoogloea sp.]
MYSLLFIIGGATTAFGVLAGNDGTYNLIAQAGSSLLGVTLAFLITSTVGDELTDSLKKLLTKPRFTSPSPNLSKYVGTWYCYYRTEDNGIPLWMHATATLRLSSDEIGLHGELSCHSDNKGETTYEIEAAFRGKTLVIFGSSSDENEEPSIDILPLFMSAHREFHCGFVIHETYDAHRPMRLSPTIYSQAPRHKITTKGPVDDEAAEELFKDWKSQLDKQYCIDELL